MMHFAHFEIEIQFRNSISNIYIYAKVLLEFKVQFGHCIVPQQYTANPKLGTWVSTQRRNYKLQKEGKLSPMTDGRIRQLESLLDSTGGQARLTSQTDYVSYTSLEVAVRPEVRGRMM